MKFCLVLLFMPCIPNEVHLWETKMPCVGVRSFEHPWEDQSSQLNDLERIDELHACQSLLLIISNVLRKKSSDFQGLSLQDVDNSGAFQWERSILETEWYLISICNIRQGTVQVMASNVDTLKPLYFYFLLIVWVVMPWEKERRKERKRKGKKGEKKGKNMYFCYFVFFSCIYNIYMMIKNTFILNVKII